MLFKHKNIRFGIITIYDSDGKGHILRPGEEVTIDRNSAGNGVVVVEEIETEEKEKKKPKKLKEDKYNDSI